MLGNSTRHTARSARHIIERTATTLALPLPKSLTKALAHADDVTSQADQMVQHSALPTAVLDALAAGQDPPTDPAVQRALIGSALAGLQFPDRAADYAATLIVDALNTHADTLLTTWAEALEDDTNAMVHAADVLPTHDLEDTKTIIRSAPDIIAAWSAAVEASKRWQAATEGFGALATTAHTDATGHLVRILPVLDADLDTARQLDTTDRRPTVWDIVCAGHEPALTTITEFRARRSRLLDELRDAEAHAEAERAARYRRALQI